jgi:hypothetical protein
MPLVFSSIQPYPPVAIAVLFYLEFMWGCASSPLSGGACHTLATVGHLPLSMHTGGGGSTPASPDSLFIYSLGGGVPLSPLWWSFPHDSHCYKFSPLQVSATPSGGGCHSYLIWPAYLFTVCVREVPLPHCPELRASYPLCYMSFFFFQLLVYYSGFFSFFPWAGVSLSRGLC